MSDKKHKLDQETFAPFEGELVEITIDGKKYEAPSGANLLEFMLHQGIDIPYFCYHPGMSVVAQCRQCLVEMVGGPPKLVPACQTFIREGLNVGNSSDRVLDARRQLLEFTLVNHPVDCPICDKAGECVLQSQYMSWDREESQVNHPKVHKPKRLDLGPRIVMDTERCILCTRCKRFMEQVVGDPQLLVAHRGDHEHLTTPPGKSFDSPYSLNTVDICPVGALTDRDFRFKMRVWELSATQSICNGCATGCEVEIHHKDNTVFRLVPRKQMDINLNWMCDFGRYSYKGLADERLTLPLIKGKEAGWDAALEKVGDALEKLLEQDPPVIGVVLGADVTNEDNYTAATLAHDYINTDKVYLAAEPDGQADGLLRSADPNPNRAGAVACGKEKAAGIDQLEKDLLAGKLKALYVVGDKLHLPGEALKKAADLELLVVQATHPSALTEAATVVLPASAFAEVDGTIVNAAGKVLRLRAAVKPPNFARPHWQILVQVARSAGMILDFASPIEIFTTMQNNLDFFKSAGWGQQLPNVLLRFAGSRG